MSNVVELTVLIKLIALVMSKRIKTTCNTKHKVNYASPTIAKSISTTK